MNIFISVSYVCAFVANELNRNWNLTSRNNKESLLQKNGIIHGKKILTKKVREFHMLIEHEQTVL